MLSKAASVNLGEIRTIDCKYYEAIYILFNTGLRISEFCELTLSDIDLKKHNLMGHSDISTTLNIYTHEDFTGAEEELKRLSII